MSEVSRVGPMPAGALTSDLMIDATPRVPDSEVSPPPRGILSITNVFILLFVAGYFVKAFFLSRDPKGYTTFAAFASYAVRPSTVLLMAAGGSALVLGSSLGRLGSWTRRPAGHRLVTDQALLARVGLTLSLLAFLILVRGSGLSPTALRPFSVETRRALLLQFAGNGPAAIFISMSPFFMVLAWRRNISVVRNFLRPLIALNFVALALVGSRLLLLGALAAITIAWALDRPNPPGPGRQTAAVAVVFVLSGVLGILLFPGQFALTSPSDVVRRVMGTFDMADSLAIAESRSARYDGATWVEDLVITYVPRAIWTSKPFDYGGYRLQEELFPGVAKSVDYVAFYPAGLLGESYLNLGALGIVLVPALAGYGLRRLEGLATTPGVGRGMYAFLCTQTLTLLRSPGQFVAYFLVLLLVVTLSQMYLGVRSAVVGGPR